jgi:hypothetical protein
MAAAGYVSGGICVFSLETGQPIQQLLAHNGFATCMQLQPNVLISGSGMVVELSAFPFSK